MRIIAGTLRHRKLLANPGQTTRPIIDRAKVQLFDRIRAELPGMNVLDAFAGTGTLGFEAISRGAARVVFCEGDHRASELLKANAKAFKVEDRTLCWRVDILRCSFRPKGEVAWAPYGVVFFDPPYEMARKLTPESPLGRCLARLARADTTTSSALLVLRVPVHEQPVLPPMWQPEYVIEIASMAIYLLRKTTVAENDLSAEELVEDSVANPDDDATSPVSDAT